VYVEDIKKWSFTKDFLKFLCRARNSVASVFSLPRVFYFALGKEASLPNVFSLSGVFYFALSKDFLPRVFYFAFRQRAEL
jgi:hypothetical protein